MTSIHTFYYLNDWPTSISKMLSMLNSQGKLAIVIRTDDEVCKFKNQFMIKQEKDFPLLCDILTQLNIPFETDVIISSLDVSGILENNLEGQQLIEFLLRTKYESLSEEVKLSILSYMQKHHSNGIMFHDDGVVWIKKD